MPAFQPSDRKQLHELLEEYNQITQEEAQWRQKTESLLPEDRESLRQQLRHEIPVRGGPIGALVEERRSIAARRKAWNAQLRALRIEDRGELQALIAASRVPEDLPDEL